MIFRKGRSGTDEATHQKAPPGGPSCATAAALRQKAGPVFCSAKSSGPGWEFVFQPKYAAYLNLIEPWWKVLRSLAPKGRRFEAWPEIEQAVRRATAYWNEHKHPFLWGRRRRHRTSRRPGIAAVPNFITT